MKNYVSSGETVTFPAPYDVASGGGALVGSLFGVAQNAAISGDPVVLVPTGVFKLPKAASQAWTLGAKVYWDDTNKRCTTVATGNTLVGTAHSVVGGTADETLGEVRLGIVA